MTIINISGEYKQIIKIATMLRYIYTIHGIKIILFST